MGVAVSQFLCALVQFAILFEVCGAGVEQDSSVCGVLWERWWWVEVVGWAEAVWERLYAVCYVVLELVEGCQLLCKYVIKCLLHGF